MNTSLHILAFRLKYVPVKDAFDDCDTIKLKNKRTSKHYTSIINISCLFRIYCLGINKALFLCGVFIPLNFPTLNAIKPIKM